MSFRLSDEEFRQLREASEETGAKSMSEFARSAVLAAINGGAQQQRRPGLREELMHLQDSVVKLRWQLGKVVASVRTMGRKLRRVQHNAGRFESAPGRPAA